MLRRLQVKNYVLIDSLDIEFPEGLVIITGQTGAGKSILLGSISLVLGSKADAAVIGDSADNCVVEAEFDIGRDDSALRHLLEENDIEAEDDRLVLRRVVSRSGRARAFANDSPVSAGVLSSLSAHLIDIHSQHQTLLLSDRRFQLSALDHYAGNSLLLDRCAALYREYISLKADLDDLNAKIARIEGERDYDQARYSQLESANLRDGELEALEAEQRQLANAEEIKDSLYAVETLFSSDDEGGRLSLDAILRESTKRLERISQYVPGITSVLERIASARVELDDILAEISDMDSRTEVSQERLQQVEDRLSLLYGLMQKFSCRDIAGLVAVRDSLKAVLHDSSAFVERRAELEARLDTVTGNLASVAGQLHDTRLKAAPSFAHAVQDSIRSLELQHAVFEVSLQEAPLSASGKDSAVFLFSSTGRNAVELSRCASGGEMSRIMLCLKEMMAHYTMMPTMIFDEIDTGVSGSVADKMGSMICRMGDNMQVFAITHLPQVAAKGKAHYLVSKITDTVSGKTSTTIARLSPEERVMEMARMLSGSEVTSAAIENARTLLSLSDKGD